MTEPTVMTCDGRRGAPSVFVIAAASTSRGILPFHLHAPPGADHRARRLVPSRWTLFVRGC